MQISGARENRSAGVNHDRQAVRLSPLINRRQAAIAVQVVVGRKHLMRGMYFDSTNPELCEAVYFRAWIANRSRQHSAERDETIRGCAAILCAPVIHFRREPDDLWSDVIDQPRALHSESVQKGEKRLRIGRIFFHVSKVVAPMFH